MNEDTARRDICEVGRSLFARGYVHATAGNISVRLPDGFLITPTDACLGFLSPDGLSKVDLQGQPVSGPRASKTLQLHRRIYEASASTPAPAGCIIHTHSTHCVALTLDAPAGDLLPPITPYFVMKVGHVPVVPYLRPGDPRAGDEVAAQIGAHAAADRAIRAVMLSRLGPNVWHDTPMQAMAVLEELEETARLWLLGGRSTRPLDEASIGELREAFGARW
ncbi:class II aldolase/adducin family protein [Ramlibacter pallidus]|uniref:Aldolase n=1 Tax=Ramlibacter pallidus TaxID=2780087 RepID=A0ABR9S9U0_9BURK|nr:aldolase [Ramlibacter pallidus]MBE7370042.1 aldolase [Ramlibacter pallidus]